jgi:hypothetical protein
MHGECTIKCLLRFSLLLQVGICNIQFTEILNRDVSQTRLETVSAAILNAFDTASLGLVKAVLSIELTL